MKVLMSIKPKYADKILSGEKKYELRRKIFKEKVDSIIIYSSSPVMKVVGEVEVDGVIVDKPEEIFQRFKPHLCISESDYFDYFGGVDTAYAIKIGKVIKYTQLKELNDFGVERAPQSYVYVK